LTPSPIMRLTITACTCTRTVSLSLPALAGVTRNTARYRLLAEGWTVTVATPSAPTWRVAIAFQEPPERRSNTTCELEIPPVSVARSVVDSPKVIVGCETFSVRLVGIFVTLTDIVVLADASCVSSPPNDTT
jgi:hypothetical protein